MVVDSLRYDVAASLDALKSLAPNIARLAEQGFVRRTVANAQSTQFVLPSLFTLTHPLDYGGYNRGILDRPKSFVEVLRDNGFRTLLYATCNQLGLTNGYQRGFDVIGTTSDYRTQLEYRITREGVGHSLALFDRGEITEAALVEVLRRDYGHMLDALMDGLKHHDKSIWPGKLMRLNARIGERCGQERALLDSDPMAIARKLRRIAPGVYWRFLGDRNVPAGKLFWARLVTAINWRSRNLIARQNIFPFLPLQHYQALFGEVVKPVARALKAIKDRPWFLYIHTVDVHDCRAINRPLHLLGRLRYLPRWLKAKRAGHTQRRFLYDSALMYSDQCLGRLLAILERDGSIDRTVFVITGDHGFQFAESPRRKTPVGERMHYEDIEVPLIVSGADAPASRTGLLDSRAVTASLLHALSVEPHPSFGRAHAFGPGLDVVVSENCGSGAADLVRRDIYFAITGLTHKMFAVLKGGELLITKLFDLRSDPKELRNVAAEPANAETIASLVRRLFSERHELFRLRGIGSPPLPPHIVVSP
jgi:hypothetical protein